MTLLISSHILSEVEQIADRVGVLADGSITQEISMPEIRAACPNGLEPNGSDSLRILCVFCLCDLADYTSKVCHR